jgi:2-keto-4-pentenoate hydratase/2-oxohepta-3-ene-1,7-dioic acid hydratase in catechol pathway
MKPVTLAPRGVQRVGLFAREDVTSTGTPAGVGFTRKPPRWLRPGEIMRVEIAALGVLENPVAKAP